MKFLKKLKEFFNYLPPEAEFEERLYQRLEDMEQHPEKYHHILNNKCCCVCCSCCGICRISER